MTNMLRKSKNQTLLMGVLGAALSLGTPGCIGDVVMDGREEAGVSGVEKVEDAQNEIVSSCPIATRSSLNYNSGRNIAPQSDVLNVVCPDGYVPRLNELTQTHYGIRPYYDPQTGTPIESIVGHEFLCYLPDDSGNLTPAPEVPVTIQKSKGIPHAITCNNPNGPAYVYSESLTYQPPVLVYPDLDPHIIDDRTLNIVGTSGTIGGICSCGPLL